MPRPKRTTVPDDLSQVKVTADKETLIRQINELQKQLDAISYQEDKELLDSRVRLHNLYSRRIFELIQRYHGDLTFIEQQMPLAYWKRFPLPSLIPSPRGYIREALKPLKESIGNDPKKRAEAVLDILYSPEFILRFGTEDTQWKTTFGNKQRMEFKLIRASLTKELGRDWDKTYLAKLKNDSPQVKAIVKARNHYKEVLEGDKMMPWVIREEFGKD